VTAYRFAETAATLPARIASPIHTTIAAPILTTISAAAPAAIDRGG
jgi:hypothetical protein